MLYSINLKTTRKCHWKNGSVKVHFSVTEREEEVTV